MIALETMIAVNIDVIIPMVKVTAKPFIGPVPKLNNTIEAMRVVMFASAIVSSAFS